LHSSRRIFSLPQIGHNIAGSGVVVDLTCRCWHPLEMLAIPDPGEREFPHAFSGGAWLSACAELTAKLANYRGGMLLAGLQSWQPGLNFSAARWWAAL